MHQLISGQQSDASKNAVIVARVSTAAQADNTSFEVQYGAGKKLADAKGLNIVRYYQETATGAGYLTRVQTQQALKDIEAGLAKNIIFYDFSRFSRDREYQETFRKRIERAGGRLLLCTGEFDDTPEGDLNFGIQGELASYERKNIARRCSNGRAEKLKAGKQPYRTIVSFGYRCVSNNDVIRGTHPAGSEGTYEIIEEQAVWVRKMYEMFNAGDSCRTIAKFLHRNGVPTKQGGIWEKTTVRGLLKRSIYKGKCAVNKRRRMRDESRLALGLSEYYSVPVPDDQQVFLDVPAIVSEEVWQLAKDRLDKGRAISGRKDRKYLLTSLLFCPTCGFRLTGLTVKKAPTKKRPQGSQRRHYKCHKSITGLSTTGAAACSNSHEYNMESINNLVIEALNHVATRRENIEHAYNASMSDVNSASSRLKALSSELAALDRKELITAQKQVEAEIEGRPTGAYDVILREVAARKTIIENQLKTIEESFLTKPEISSRADVLASITADVTKVLHATDDLITVGEKNTMLGTIVEKVVPTDGGIAMQLKAAGTECLMVTNKDGELKISVFNREAYLNLSNWRTVKSVGLSSNRLELD